MSINGLVHLGIADHLTPYLEGIKSYVASVGMCTGDLLPLPSDLAEVRHGGPRGHNGFTHAAVIYPSEALVRWFEAFVAMSKASPQWPSANR